MALMVKHNLAAINTLNQLNKNDSALQKDVQRLSSGMKINGAADDASGYAIADKMDVQTRSLQQDSDNTQNGQSVLKTASGALSSTVDILRTLKEKAINAANDTNTDSDRETMQKEFDQAIDQIDENAQTSFNGMTMLDGSKNHYVVPGGTVNVVTNKNFSIFGNFTLDSPLDTLEDKSGKKLSIQPTDQIEVSFFKNGKFVDETVSAWNPLYGGNIVSIADVFDNDNLKKNLALEVFDSSRPNYIGRDNTGADVYANPGDLAVNVKSSTPGVDGQIVGFSFCIKDSKGNPRTDMNKIFNNFQETIPAENQSPDNAFQFQTGTKSNQSVKMSFADMRAKALGLRTGTDPEVTISVRTKEQANAAIQALDTALQKALDQQTNVGAVSSKLEFTDSNIVTANENTQASMSTIRDADMAHEATEHAKHSILVQTAQAMLAQANQNSSSVLSLLQGQ